MVTPKRTSHFGPKKFELSKSKWSQRKNVEGSYGDRNQSRGKIPAREKLKLIFKITCDMFRRFLVRNCYPNEIYIF